MAKTTTHTARLLIIMCAFYTTVHLFCCAYMVIQENGLDKSNEEYDSSMQYAVMFNKVGVLNNSRDRLN